MSEKHTPGPWFVDTDGDQTTNDMYWGVVSKHNDLWVAACYRSGTTPRDEKSPEADAEAKANAALIARAPTLAAEVEELRAENDKLRTVMVAAAEEIHAHWGAHCDSEGYGPANLMRRLEEGIPAEYGYTAGRFAELQAESAAERRKVEALRSASVDSRGWLVEWRYHGSVQWLYLRSAAGGGFSFTADASKALRLARREDAEAVLEWARDTDSRRGLHSSTFLVTEHVWESAALASTEGGA